MEAEKQKHPAEQALLDAIAEKPGFTVSHGRMGGVLIAQQLPGGVRQQSVWLGRSNTIAKLREIEAAK